MSNANVSKNGVYKDDDNSRAAHNEIPTKIVEVELRRINFIYVCKPRKNLPTTMPETILWDNEEGTYRQTAGTARNSITAY